MAANGRKGCAGYEQQIPTYVYAVYEFMLVNKLQCP